MDIRKVGVVGCGLMGSGIAQCFAQKGFTVVVREVNQELLDRGIGKIRDFLKGGVAKGKLTQQDADATLGRLTGTTKFEDFRDCDLVVEAVIENMDEKKKVFSALDEITPKHAILASNTSSLSVTTMAAATRRPSQVIGMHFFNPVPIMPLVEIVMAFQTSPETLATVRAASEKLAKQTVVAKDRPGFLVNLFLIPYLMDCIRALDAGVGSKEDIDKAMKLGCNHPMGPFELADFVGLDTCLYIADILFEEYRDARYAAPPLLRRMVVAGYHGKKTGKGFYDYSKK
ncbi:MAG: 3-hydroxybutyryl-CoA dehydrogenase [Planctomycetota bacterium]